jgi:Bardet-Biedl syndrome 9 protein
MILISIRNELNQRAQQFRVIQKRLLVRFKDKNAAPLQHMDLLLEGTYKQLIELSEVYTNNEKALKEASNNLACATQLMLSLIR